MVGHAEDGFCTKPTTQGNRRREEPGGLAAVPAGTAASEGPPGQPPATPGAAQQRRQRFCTGLPEEGVGASKEPSRAGRRPPRAHRPAKGGGNPPVGRSGPHPTAHGNKQGRARRSWLSVRGKHRCRTADANRRCVVGLLDLDLGCHRWEPKDADAALVLLFFVCL